MQAQDLSFEYQSLYLANGKSLRGWLAYDYREDGVLFKVDQQREAQFFSAKEISDFSYQEDDYMALPFRYHKSVIFKVAYQGNEVAVLQKHLNRKNYMLIDEDFTAYPLGSSSTEDSLYVDQAITTSGEYGTFTTTHENQYRVENCLFLATLDGIFTWNMELSYMHIKKGRKSIFVSPYKNAKRELIRLLSIADRIEKENLRAYIFSNRLDISSSSDLILTLKKFEHLN